MLLALARYEKSPKTRLHLYAKYYLVRYDCLPDSQPKSPCYRQLPSVSYITELKSGKYRHNKASLNDPKSFQMSQQSAN